MCVIGDDVNQENLFDFAKGLELRNAGVAKVEANANQQWKDEALQIVRKLASGKQPFTSDDVWAALVGKSVTPEPRAMGAVFLKASRAGVIRPTGEYWQSKRPECHARRIAVWVGC